jgi:hypothetical protein
MSFYLEKERKGKEGKEEKDGKISLLYKSEREI